MKYKLIVLKEWPPIINFFISAGAISIYPFLFTVRGWEKNRAVMLHEELHLREQKEMGTIKWLLKYLFSKSFRYDAELRGHAMAVANGYNLKSAAKEFSENYNLGITPTEAKRAIKQEIRRGNYNIDE